jgi:hypothetical protein
MSRAMSNLSPALAALAAATLIAACGSSSSSLSSSSASGHQPTHVTRQQMQQDVVRFAACMRSHGINLPNPNSPEQFKSALGGNHSPAFQSAALACGHLLPGGGPGQPSAAHTEAQKAAALAFARCIRTHGFPNFPDPTSNGDLTHEMLANAGINIHQPAAVQAADACVGVTHGFITRAAVARFIAGQ